MRFKQLSLPVLLCASVFSCLLMTSHGSAWAKQAAPARGPITDAEINMAVERDAPAMIELRHQVHQHPELSNREFETSKLVAERLELLGWMFRPALRILAWSES